MCADNQLRAQVFRVLQLVVFAQYSVGLIDEDLLHLGVQVGLRLFDEDKMKRGNQHVVGRDRNAGLADFHPLVSEAHQRKDDGNEVLVAEAVGFFWQAVALGCTAWEGRDLVLNGGAVIQAVDGFDAGGIKPFFASGQNTMCDGN